MKSNVPTFFFGVLLNAECLKFVEVDWPKCRVATELTDVRVLQIFDWQVSRIIWIVSRVRCRNACVEWWRILCGDEGFLRLIGKGFLSPCPMSQPFLWWSAWFWYSRAIVVWPAHWNLVPRGHSRLVVCLLLAEGGKRKLNPDMKKAGSNDKCNFSSTNLSEGDFWIYQGFIKGASNGWVWRWQLHVESTRIGPVWIMSKRTEARTRITVIKI